MRAAADVWRGLARIVVRIPASFSPQHE